MQKEPIILIPPTHEQSVYTFQLLKKWEGHFLEFLKKRGITPWRPPTTQNLAGPDGNPVVEVEVDVKDSVEAMQRLLEEFQTHELRQAEEMSQPGR